MLEDSLLSETVDRDTYKSKSVELRAAIENIDTELTNLESNRNFDFFDVLEEILALTRNIPKTYKEAPDFLKKKYLNLFFDQIQVNDKKIENTVFSPLITVLIEQQKVILRSNWLPSPSDNIKFNSKLERATNNIFNVFKDTTYAIQLKMKWESIKKVNSSNL